MISRKENSEIKTLENQFKVGLNQTGTFNIRNAIHTGSKKRHFMVVLLPLSSALLHRFVTFPYKMVCLQHISTPPPPTPFFSREIN